MGGVTKMVSTKNGARRIITLCGSSRFKDEFMALNARETLLGNIVLTMGFFHHMDKVPITAEQKVALDKLHCEKIDMSHEILVINPNGYIGESTRNEIDHANKANKWIRFYEAPEAGKCKRCYRDVVLPGAIYCGAACTARYEAGP